MNGWKGGRERCPPVGRSLLAAGSPGPRPAAQASPSLWTPRNALAAPGIRLRAPAGPSYLGDCAQLALAFIPTVRLDGTQTSQAALIRSRCRPAGREWPPEHVAVAPGSCSHPRERLWALGSLAARAWPEAGGSSRSSAGWRRWVGGIPSRLLASRARTPRASQTWPASEDSRPRLLWHLPRHPLPRLRGALQPHHSANTCRHVPRGRGWGGRGCRA